MSDTLGTALTHPAWAALRATEQALGQFAEANLWSLPDNEVLQLRIELEALRAKTEAVVLTTTREVDSRGSAVDAGAASTAAWLRGRLLMHPGAAKAEVALALACDRDHAATGAALARGKLTRDQADAVVAGLGALPSGIDAATRGDAEEFLLREARQFDPQALHQLARHLALRLDPDRGEELEREEAERPSRQELHLSHQADGSRRVRGVLGPEDGALLEAALSARSAPRKASDGTPDPRPAAQRRAEALTELVKGAMAADDMPEEGGEPVTLTVTTPIDYLKSLVGGAACPTCGHATSATLPAPATYEDGTALTPETLRRLGCDAWLVAALTNRDGNVLDVGRLTRAIPRPLRRALTVRDRGCAFPGCGRPPRWCHGHHIWHWSLGGATALDNLVLLCGYHHRLIHHGGWHVELNTKGLPEFTPPPWIDPSQVPRPAWRPPDELHLT